MKRRGFIQRLAAVLSAPLAMKFAEGATLPETPSPVRITGLAPPSGYAVTKAELDSRYASLTFRASCPLSPVKGECYYDVGDQQVYVYDGRRWLVVAAPSVSPSHQHSGRKCQHCGTRGFDKLNCPNCGAPSVFA